MPGRNPFRADNVGANSIFTTANSFKDQIQQVELRHDQAQQKGEELRNKKIELLEVLRVFELIEDSERAKTKELEEEVAQAENNAKDAPAVHQPAGFWSTTRLGEDDVFGGNDKGPAKGPVMREVGKHDECLLAYRMGALADAGTGTRKNTVPELCKQIINSILPEPSSQTTNAEDTESHNTGVFAPLLPKRGKLTRTRTTKNAVALKKAKQKATEHWKAMPHKARRKRRSTSGFVAKSPLAYITAKEAIKTVTSGLGMNGGLWNSQQQKEKAPETWPNVLQSCMFSISDTA